MALASQACQYYHSVIVSALDVTENGFKHFNHMRNWLIDYKTRPSEQILWWCKFSPRVRMSVWDILSRLVAQVCGSPHTQSVEISVCQCAIKNSSAHAHYPNSKNFKVSLQYFLSLLPCVRNFQLISCVSTEISLWFIQGEMVERRAEKTDRRTTIVALKLLFFLNLYLEIIIILVMIPILGL